MVRKIVIALLVMGLSQAATASALINQMQTCQALLAFIEQKLSAADTPYSAADIATVNAGLGAYDAYLQNTIISPGLLKFTAGDAAKASQFQQQVDRYKQTLTQQLHARYPQNRLFMDQLVALNQCLKSAQPPGPVGEQVKRGVEVLQSLVASH